MSGHSKFANIKHKKEKNDAKKGKIFTVIGRELVIAVKAGGPDPNNNSKLRDVIAKAKANNMPNDTIERGIKKAAGADSADNYEKAVYEGYGPNGVAIIVETLTSFFLLLLIIFICCCLYSNIIIPLHLNLANGYLTNILGHIPTDKDVDTSIKAIGYCFTILSIGNKTIGKVKVERDNNVAV